MPARIEKFIRVAGFILAIGAGFSLLFCLALIGSAVEKRHSVHPIAWLLAFIHLVSFAAVGGLHFWRTAFSESNWKERVG